MKCRECPYFFRLEKTGKGVCTSPFTVKDETGKGKAVFADKGCQAKG